MKPLFTIHAGEFLVGREIERKFRHVSIWIPAKDTGVDLLISNKNNNATVSLQVKFSRDYVVTHERDDNFRKALRFSGWWALTRQQIEKSGADYWIFVLLGFAIRTTDFIIIKPVDLLKRLDVIHGEDGKGPEKIQSYLSVTKKDTCWETRGVTPSDRLLIAEGRFENKARNFTRYLNNWEPIKTLNH